ncbi:MAG: PQQ-binding-like beta-propeller repeat protein [Bryobacteraceae bacterium]
MPWYQTSFAVIGASLLFPPLGLVLLWTRRGKLGIKILASLAIALLGIVQLFKIYGLRAEMGGSGVPTFLTFQSPEDRAKAVERSRVAQPPPPITPDAAPAATVAPEVAAKASAESGDAQPGAEPVAAPLRDYWTDYRGPDRLGIYAETPILTQWPAAGLQQLWKQPVGGGYAGFVAAGGMLYTIEQRRDQEVVAAYDAATGREKWTNSWKALFQESMGGDGPRTTPVYDDGRVYALGAEGELRCIHAATGKTVWRKNILSENGASNPMWAQAASPLVVDGKLIVLPGGPGKSVVAYDKATGETIWSSQDDEQSYTAPMVMTLAGKRQLIVVSALRAMGLSIDEGKLLWSVPWVTEYHINASQPLKIADNRLMLNAGYGHGSALVELTADGGAFDAKVLWQNNRMKAKFNSPVLYEGNVYGLDEGILQCIDASSGEQKWKGGRYGYGQVLLASGHLIVLSERGELALVKATPAGHQELAQFQAIEGKTWNNHAIAGGVVYVRNASEMAAFRLK